MHYAFQIRMVPLVLLDTKENINLWRGDVAFSTLINSFRKLFEIFRFFTIPYKTTSGKSLKNPLPCSLGNACEKSVYNKFQVYSLQM